MVMNYTNPAIYGAANKQLSANTATIKSDGMNGKIEAPRELENFMGDLRSQLARQKNFRAEITGVENQRDKLVTLSAGLRSGSPIANEVAERLAELDSIHDALIKKAWGLLDVTF